MTGEQTLFDAFVNPNLGPPPDPRWTIPYLFPELEALWARKTTIEQMLEEMDAANVSMAALCCGAGLYEDDADETFTLEALERFPDRFIGTLMVDPKGGLSVLRKIDRFVNEYDFKMVRMAAFDIGLPYSHPAYWPVFGKCAEMGVAVGINVGICGPLIASGNQDPIVIDEIAHHFPELKIVMQHGGDPWIDVVVKLLLKWPNVFWMSSAWAPKRIPEQIIHLANTRAPEKIMFASDYPVMTFERCAKEIAGLPFRSDQLRRNFCSENARRLFLGVEESVPAQLADTTG